MNEHSAGSFPIAYLITIRSYGTWLHGDKRTSVDRHGFNVFGTSRLAPSNILHQEMENSLKQPPMLFDKAARVCVLAAVKEVCEYRGYDLLAINIRSNHLHTVVSGQIKPEKIVNDFKSYATRKLRQMNLIEPERIVWARGKSARYLWKTHHVENAVNYVLFGQGGEIPEFK